MMIMGKAMVTINMFTQGGVNNGTCGIIQDFLYGEGKKQNVDLPDVILLQVEDYDGPDLTQSLIGIKEYPEDIRRKLIPLTPVSRTKSSSNFRLERTN